MNAALALDTTSNFSTHTPAPQANPASKVAARRLDLGQDATWLAAFRKGEKGALERVFRVYAPYVTAILRNGCSGVHGNLCRVSGEDERMDLLQDTFVRVLSPAMRARYDNAYPFTAFLRGVVRNVMVEQVRRNARAAARYVSMQDQEDMGLEHWSVGQPLPDELFASRADRALVAAFLATLTASEKRFVELRFEGGLSQRDAADALGLGRQQVRRMDNEMRARLEAFIASVRPARAA